MAYIIPSILSLTDEDFIQKINLIKDSVELIHIDLMDGEYVTSRSISLERMSSLLDSITYHSGIELHMMVNNPLKYIESVCKIKKIKSVVIHMDSTTEIVDTIHAYKNKNLPVGLCVKLTDELDCKDLDIDYFLVLAENSPGYSGSSFDMDALAQIRTIKHEFPEKMIEVDGGINEITARSVINEGVSRLIAGSIIFKNTDPLSALNLLREIHS